MSQPRKGLLPFHSPRTSLKIGRGAFRTIPHGEDEHATRPGTFEAV